MIEYLQIKRNRFIIQEYCSLNMKNISSIPKNNKNESPKTPGGISKSLLTPCRRVGLSRNFRKSGSSPFISPLSGTDRSELQLEQKSRKRKCTTVNDTEKEVSQNNDENESLAPQISCHTPGAAGVSNGTPTRSVFRRKKSKTILLATDCEEESENVAERLGVNSHEETTSVEIKKVSPKISKEIKLSGTNSANTIIKEPPNINICHSNDKDTCVKRVESESIQTDCKQKSPDNLTKECIVVIQKKIFKSISKKDKCKLKENHQASQVLFDSDSDDTPLSILNTKEKSIKPISKNDDDNEFQENRNIAMLQHKTTSTSELKSKAVNKQNMKLIKNKMKPNMHVDSKVLLSSQDSIDPDDDDFVENKRTIQIKKTYDKTSKLFKAKSTGSITQNDIDEIKDRIKTKKNLLLAKAMTNETKELRGLIKKWQKGCQDALTELLELMKKRMPEQQNMEYSEILHLLKIPPDLVGYDSENDCFITPEDTKIILSGFDVK